jgi:hypothetical protein
MVRESLARVSPFLHLKTGTATTTSRMTQNVVRVQIIAPARGMHKANPNVNMAEDPVIMVEPAAVNFAAAEVNAVDPPNKTDHVDIADTALEAPMQINRRHSSIHGRNI